MNTTCESTVGVLIGASERLHDVASRGGGPSSDRKSRHYPKSALQKLLSMVEPIMRPLTTDLFDGDKEEISTSQHSIEEIISCSGQRNSFQQFLRARETPSCSFVKEFQFLCLCKEFKEWHEKPQYGPYRTRVLANYIFDNFIREGGSQSLLLSETIRRNIERMRTSDGKVLPTMFEEAYQYVSMVIIQQNVVKSFVESHYYQTMWDEEELDCNLFKALSLGGTSSLYAPRSKPFGSAGSTDPSSSSSSLSRYSRSNVLAGGLSSAASSSSVSEIQSISSSKTGSSKSSTGSNASAAFDKYYSSKNSQKKSNKKKGLVIPAKLMEELLPRLEVISLEQSMRIQNYGSLDQGPHGDDTPVVVRNKRMEVGGDSVDMSGLDHMTHHSLPHHVMPFNPHFNPPANLSSEIQLSQLPTSQLNPLSSQLNSLSSQLNQHHVTPTLYHLPQPALHQTAGLPSSQVMQPSSSTQVMQSAVMQPSSAVMQPSVMQPSVMQPSVMQPSVMQPSVMQTSVMQPSVMQPSVMQPSVMQPSVMQPSVMHARTRERTSSNQSLEQMICEEEEQVPTTDGNVAQPTQAWPVQEGVRDGLTTLCTQAPPPPIQQLPEIQLVYTFGSDGSCYGKAVTASRVTLREFKEIVAWGNCGLNTRYFFKRQLAGIGEVHDEISQDDATLPFWAPNTIYARIERDPH